MVVAVVVGVIVIVVAQDIVLNGQFAASIIKKLVIREAAVATHSLNAPKVLCKREVFSLGRGVELLCGTTACSL